MQLDSLQNKRSILWVGGRELEVALAPGGGHIAALKIHGLSPAIEPFWQPPWKSFEPSEVNDHLLVQHYGGRPEGRLLASILGHSLAIDFYGAPSPEEIQAGGVTHGRVGVSSWEWTSDGHDVAFGDCIDEASELHVSRRVHVRGFCVSIEEHVRNLCKWDRPIGWQQHVSIGAPFCEDGFWARANCARGLTHPEAFGSGTSLIQNRETVWPKAPRRDGCEFDYTRPLEGAAMANDFTGFEIRPTDELGYFVAGNTEARVALFYAWPRTFFPWLGVWDEKHGRTTKPWEGRVSVRGYEFGVSPLPLSRRQFLAQPYLYNVPAFAILPARSELWVKYALGVFPDVATPGDFAITKEAGVLMNKGKEVSRVPFHGGFEASVRPEMQVA